MSFMVTPSYTTKSAWNRPDPKDPTDVSVQVQLRMPYWYREALMETAPGMSVASIILDFCGRHVSQVKPK